MITVNIGNGLVANATFGSIPNNSTFTGLIHSTTLHGHSYEGVFFKQTCKVFGLTKDGTQLFFVNENYNVDIKVSNYKNVNVKIIAEESELCT
jgi:hypothetical protein